MSVHLIAKGLSETIPEHAKGKVAARLPEYLRQLEGPMRACAAGLYVRRLQGTGSLPIYKFRVNNGDRILFAYDQEIGGLRRGLAETGIVLLEYCPHDRQVSRGRRIRAEQAAASADPFALASYTEADETEDFKERQSYWESCSSIFDAASLYLADEERLCKIIENEEPLWQLYLSEEQYACVRNSARVQLVQGGAGTGKSTVGLHKLMALSEQQTKLRLGYITYAEKLRKDTEKLFGEYQKTASSQNLSTVSFYSFDKLCLKLLGLETETPVVKARRFVRAFREGEFRSYERSSRGVQALDALEVWQELRGQIKGGMGQCWLRRYLVRPGRGLGESTLQWMESQKFAKKNAEGAYALQEKYGKWLKSERQKGESDAARQARKYGSYLEKQAGCEALMEEEDYLALSEKWSIYNKKEQRRTLFKIAVEYQKWLDETGQMDENDLARRVLQKLDSGEMEPEFDYLVVDEVQDLSELQLYLLKRLRKTTQHRKEAYLFSGDIQQIINPTYFDFGRLRMPFYFEQEKKEMEPTVLKRNYRCQEPIVALGNALAQKRAQWCGAQGQGETEPLQALLQGGPKPQWLQATPENRPKLLAALNHRRRTYVDVLVADEAAKEQLRQAGYDSARLYTVQEFKGSEATHIVIYNLLGSCRQAWEELLQGKSKKQARYRYYVNLLYVAITRAKKQLCFYEENPPAGWLEEWGSLIEYREAYDEAALGLAHIEVDTELQLKAALCEEEGKFAEAIEHYQELGQEYAAARCRGKEAEAAGQWQEAAERFLEAAKTTEPEARSEALLLAMAMGSRLQSPGICVEAGLGLSLTPPELEAAVGEAKLHAFLGSLDEGDWRLEGLVKQYVLPRLQDFGAQCAEIRGALGA